MNLRIDNWPLDLESKWKLKTNYLPASSPLFFCRLCSMLPLLLVPSWSSSKHSPSSSLRREFLHSLALSPVFLLCVAQFLSNHLLWNLCWMVKQQLDVSPFLKMIVRGCVCPAGARTHSIGGKLPPMLLAEDMFLK